MAQLTMEDKRHVLEAERQELKRKTEELKEIALDLAAKYEVYGEYSEETKEAELALIIWFLKNEPAKISAKFPDVYYKWKKGCLLLTE